MIVLNVAWQMLWRSIFCRKRKLPSFISRWRVHDLGTNFLRVKKIKIIRAKSRRTQFAFASDIRGKRRVLFTIYHVFKTVLFLCPHNLVPTQCLYSYTLCTICTLRIAIHSSAITKHFLLFYFANSQKNIYTPDVHTNRLYRVLFQCMLASTTKC